MRRFRSRIFSYPHQRGKSKKKRIVCRGCPVQDDVVEDSDNDTIREDESTVVEVSVVAFLKDKQAAKRFSNHLESAFEECGGTVGQYAVRVFH